MRRKRIAKSSGNHERWLVSYADFITLLFAFFVIMFVSAQADKSHAKAVSEAIKKALAHDNSPPSAPQVSAPQVSAPKTSTAAQTPPNQISQPAGSDLSQSLETLKKDLRGEIEEGNVRLGLEPRGLIISLEAGAFFPSGTAGISPSAYPTVGKVANVMNQLSNSIRLEGHTDSLPISNSRFQSNWELSASRSIAMLRLLSERFGVDSRRMAILGYADNEAVDSNDTENGRLRNRRVDIVIVNEKVPSTSAP